jgi:hypothetical protein
MLTYLKLVDGPQQVENAMRHFLNQPQYIEPPRVPHIHSPQDPHIDPHRLGRWRAQHIDPRRLERPQVPHVVHHHLHQHHHVVIPGAQPAVAPRGFFNDELDQPEDEFGLKAVAALFSTPRPQ